MAIAYYRDGCEVWTEVEPGAKYTGRCIGTGSDALSALQDARAELLAELQAVDRNIRRLKRQPKPKAGRHYEFDE